MVCCSRYFINQNLTDIFNRFLYNLMCLFARWFNHRLIKHVQRVNVRTHPCVASLEQIVKEMGSSKVSLNLGWEYKTKGTLFVSEFLRCGCWREYFTVGVRQRTGPSALRLSRRA